MANITNSNGNFAGITQEKIHEVIFETYSQMENASDEQIRREVVKRLGVEDKMVVFYGFQGILANRFTLINKDDLQEVKLRCIALSDTVVPSFHDIVQFFKFFQSYDKPEGTLKPISYDEAMADLRINEKINKNEESFDDVEEDEFDDNCTEDCIPGNHVCGK